MSNAKKIIDFLNDNEVSFDVPGCYGLPKNVVIDAVNEFMIKGNSEIIEKHKRWTWGCWDLKGYTECRVDTQSSSYWIELRELKEFWGDDSDVELLENIIAKTQKVEEVRKEYSYKRKNGFTIDLKNRCKKRDDYRCVKCESDKKIEVDHKIELIDGGDNSIENLQTLCKGCHLKKTKTERQRRRER